MSPLSLWPTLRGHGGAPPPSPWRRCPFPPPQRRPRACSSALERRNRAGSDREAVARGGANRRWQVAERRPTNSPPTPAGLLSLLLMPLLFFARFKKLTPPLLFPPSFESNTSTLTRPCPRTPPRWSRRRTRSPGCRRRSWCVFSFFRFCRAECRDPGGKKRLLLSRRVFSPLAFSSFPPSPSEGQERVKTRHRVR